MLAVTEQRARYSALREADLHRLWEGQRFPHEALTTCRGERLRVIFPGLHRGGPGPDFRAASIAAPGGLIQGDVELHVRTSDFRRHGHHRDAAYDNVVLHLVFWDDDGTDTTLACGRRVPVVALAPQLVGSPRGLADWLSGPPLWQEPCRTALERLGPSAAALALDRLGEVRFRQKVDALAQEMAQGEAEEVLYSRLLESLGYSENREPFLALARRLPWRDLQPSLLAVPQRGRAGEAERRLSLASRGLTWRTRGLRPGNGPRLRLAAAACLAARYAGPGLLAGLMEAVVQAGCGGPSALGRALVVREGGRALVGPARAGEMAVNVVLPFAVAWGDVALAEAARALYRRWPRPSPFSVTGHLDRALSTGSREGVRVDARRQQGMLHLYRNYCTQGGCGRCSLS